HQDTAPEPHTTRNAALPLLSGPASAITPLHRRRRSSAQGRLTRRAPQPRTGRLVTAHVEDHPMPIEQVAPECARLVDLQQEVEWLGSGFGADATALGLPWWPAEGPVWWQEGGYLLFSDIGQSKRMKWAPGE